MNRYDWSKLDAGWSYSAPKGGALIFAGRVFAISDVNISNKPLGWADGEYVTLWPQARAQLAKCRIVDNTPLFEAMDRIAVEAGAEDVPQYVCSACGKHGLHLCEKFYPEPPSTKWFCPSQPWRRGPLATWTLVNISNHDGRLTVVMRRGRGEVLIETGVDDEGIWERLGLKAVELDKAKEKSNE